MESNGLKTDFIRCALKWFLNLFIYYQYCKKYFLRVTTAGEWLVSWLLKLASRPGGKACFLFLVFWFLEFAFWNLFLEIYIYT